MKPVDRRLIGKDGIGMKKIKNKIRFYKALIIEVIETLCSICLYLERQRYNYPSPNHFRSHFTVLKGFSEKLRGDYDEVN